MRTHFKSFWNSLVPFPLTSMLLVGFIVLSPLAADRQMLPLGWEIPKVFFTQVISLVLLVTFGVELLRSRSHLWKALRLPRYLPVVLGIFIFIALISTFLSQYTRDTMILSQINPLYRFLESAGLEISRIAVFGNPFRDFGIISFLAVIAIGAITMFSTPKARNVLLSAFIVSAVIQSIIGIYQFADLVRADTLSPFSGTLIAGTFGQANFYAGHLLLGLVFSLYFLKNGNRWDFLLLIPIVLIFGGLSASFSVWAIILALLTVFLIITYEITPVKLKAVLFSSILAVSVAASLIVLALSYSSPQPNRYRTYIWKNTIDEYVVEPTRDLSPENAKLLLFGSGLDTLGEKFAEDGKLKDNYVDRAHNVFLDTLAAFGIFGVISWLTLLSIFIYKWVRNITSPVVFYVGLAAVIWIARSFIHTSSVINITDATIIFGLLAGLTYSPVLSTTSSRSA